MFMRWYICCFAENKRCVRTPLLSTLCLAHFSKLRVPLSTSTFVFVLADATEDVNRNKDVHQAGTRNLRLFPRSCVHY